MRVYTHLGLTYSNFYVAMSPLAKKAKIRYKYTKIF